MRHLEHSKFRMLAAVLLAGVSIAALLAVSGCRKSLERETKLEAVDVQPALEIPTGDDQQAVKRPPALIGVLPEDFPGDLPLYLPASLVDFGTAADGWIYVELLTPHPRAGVERELAKRLVERGWSAAPAGGFQQLRRAGVQARLRVVDARPGTQYRFEYPAG